MQCRINNKATPELNLSNSTIIRQKIEESLKTFIINKSSGVDGISMDMIKASIINNTLHTLSF